MATFTESGVVTGPGIVFHVDDSGVKALNLLEQRLQNLSRPQVARRIRGQLAKAAGKILFDSVVNTCKELIYDQPPRTYDNDFPETARSFGLLDSHDLITTDDGVVIVRVDPEAVSIRPGEGREVRVADYASAVHDGYTQVIFGRRTNKAIQGRPWMRIGLERCTRKLINSIAVNSRILIEAAIKRGEVYEIPTDEAVPAKIFEGYQALDKAAPRWRYLGGKRWRT